jgi:teichuronic acid biosynthesis glycosyltransferase TuaG
MNSLVTVITPVYNSSSYLRQCIESVLSQTYKNFEYIIVDDSSTDESSSIISEYSVKDSRIRVVRSQTNQGVSHARNMALDLAKGRYVAFLDSDDWWMPHKLEKQIEFMNANNYVFTFTPYYLGKENGEPTDKLISVPPYVDYQGLLRRTVIGCLTVVIDIEAIGKFKMPALESGQDTLTWLKILKKGHMAYSLNEPLAYYRRKEGILWGTRLKTLRTKWYMYRDLEGLSFGSSLFNFISYAIYAFKKRVSALWTL